MSVVIAPKHIQIVDSTYYDWLETQKEPIINVPAEGRTIFRGDVMELQRKTARRPFEKKPCADFEVIGISSTGKKEDMTFRIYLRKIETKVY